MPALALLATLLTALTLGSTRAAADGSQSFGTLQDTPILWEQAGGVELTSTALRFTQPGSEARSQPLALEPQHYYRISVKMARGPGSVTMFSISYLDAHGNSVEWLPSWQLKGATHPSWLPLSLHPQRYIQGFILPRGATQARLHLRLEPGDKVLQAHQRWELTELRIDAERAAPSCKALSADRLLGGDFEGDPQDGLPAFWVQWSRSEQNQVQLISTDSACKHVLRVQPGTQVLVASSYPVPVTRGTSYRIQLLARGHGRIELDAHSLSRDRPVPLRIGNARRGAGALEIASDTWTKLDQEWFAEAPNIVSAQVYISINAQSSIEIDAVQLRECISVPKSTRSPDNP